MLSIGIGCWNFKFFCSMQNKEQEKSIKEKEIMIEKIFMELQELKWVKLLIIQSYWTTAPHEHFPPFRYKTTRSSNLFGKVLEELFSQQQAKKNSYKLENICSESDSFLPLKFRSSTIQKVSSSPTLFKFQYPITKVKVDKTTQTPPKLKISESCENNNQKTIATSYSRSDFSKF